MYSRGLIITILQILVVLTQSNGQHVVFKPTQPTETPTSAVFEFIIHTLKDIVVELQTFPASEMVKFRDSVKESFAEVIVKLEQIEETVRQQETTLGVQTQLISKLDRSLGEIKDLLNTQGSNTQSPITMTNEPCMNGATVYAKMDVDSLIHTQTIEIPNPIGGRGYKICSSSEQGHLIIHSEWESDIRIIDLATNLFVSQHTAEFKIHKMVETSVGEYVAVGYNDNIHDRLDLLDANLQSVTSYICKTGHYIWDIIYISQHRFIMLENTINIPFMVTITTITVTDDSFTTDCKMEVPITSDDNLGPEYIEVSADMNVIYMASLRFVYRVDIVENEYTYMKLSDNIFSMYRFGDYILLGDTLGDVHQLDDSIQYIQQLANLHNQYKPIILGMTRRSGKLYIAGDDNAIEVYQ